MASFEQQQMFDGRYRLLKKIGKGGFAEVWKALDTLTETEVAVKVLSPDGGLSDGVRSSYINEFRNTLKLSHQNLLRPLHYGEVADYAYVIMPLCEGGSLEDAVVQGRAFTEEELVKVIYQTSSALAYIHDKGILHNDIKPSNILVSEGGEYQLSDFGISSKTRFAVVRNSIERRNMVSKIQETASALSIAYAANELFGENPINTAKSDVFSLGVAIHELATGMLPWMGQGGVALNNGAAIPNLPADKYSDHLNWLYRSCLHSEPANRPAAHDIAKSTKFFLEKGHWGSEIGTDSPARTRKKTFIGQFTPVMWAVGLLGLVGLFASLFMFFKPQAPASENNSQAVRLACTSPILNEIKANPAGLIIAKEGEAPPMFWCSDYDKMSDCKGFEYEFGQMLAGKLGIDKVSYAVDEYDNLPDLVKTRKAHLIISGYIADDTDSLEWSESYLDFGLCLIVGRGSKVLDTRDLNAPGKKILVYEGDDTAADWVKENIPKATIIAKADPAEASGIWMKGLENGQADAVIYDYPFAIAEIQESYPTLKIVKLNLNSSNYSVGMPAGNLCFREQVNQAISEIRESPRYADLIKKYLKSDAVQVSREIEPGKEVHVVVQGETLSLIAKNVLGDVNKWKDIYDANKDWLANPNLIYKGDKLVMPQRVNI